MGNPSGQIGQSGPPTAGTYLAILFHKPLPAMKAADVKKLLAPGMDFDKHSATELYANTLPPEVQQAIKHKRGRDGMDREQGLMAVGRPVDKTRENKGGLGLAEWI